MDGGVKGSREVFGAAAGAMLVMAALAAGATGAGAYNGMDREGMGRWF